MKKKTSYTPSKSTNEKAGAILERMRIEQARLDLSKSNKKLGIVVPKSLDVSTSDTTTRVTTSNNNNNNSSRPRSKKL